MHFNIYVDQLLGQRLTECAVERGVTRNRLIREALQCFVSENKQGWPAQILDFEGVPDFPAFELNRAELLMMAEDPLA